MLGIFLGPLSQIHPRDDMTKLTNSAGYSYNLKRKNKNGSLDWEIVSTVLSERVDTAQPYPNLPKPIHLARTANRHRQNNRQKNPKDLSFTLDVNYIGQEFFQKDIQAANVDITLKLLSDKKIERIQRKAYRTIQGRLHTCWDRYDNGHLTPMQLLAECSHFVPF